MYAAEPQPPVLDRGALAWLVSVSRLLAWIVGCVFAALCSLPCASCACCARCSVGLCRQAILENIASPNRKQTESEPKAI